MHRPLDGKRIVITRGREQAAEFGNTLASLGAIPLFFPTIQFVPLSSPALDDALSHWDTYDWIVFTSVNAVRFFCQRLNLGEYAHPAPNIAVSGSATAGALTEETGIIPTFMPETFVAEELAQGLGALDGQRVLLPRSRIGRQVLVEMLRKQGATVDDVALYDTAIAQPDAQDLKQLRDGFDVVTFASPSSVHNFMELLDKNNISRALLQDSVIACIGPVTADAVKSVGLCVDVAANPHTIDGLVEGLAGYYRDDARAVTSSSVEDS